MLNIGTGELLLIALVALIVFGPNKLPEILRNAGRAWRAFQLESQKAADQFKQGLEQAGNQPANQPAPGVIDSPDRRAPEAPGAAPARPPAPAGDGGLFVPVDPAARPAAAPEEEAEPEPDPAITQLRRYEDT